MRPRNEQLFRVTFLLSHRATLRCDSFARLLTGQADANTATTWPLKIAGWTNDVTATQSHRLDGIEIAHDTSYATDPDCRNIRSLRISNEVVDRPEAPHSL